MTAAAPVLPVPRLLVWRHGRTEWNAEGRFQGQLDPPLDDVGRDQAALAAAHLVAGGLDPDETVVESSDLTRAAETAATLTALLGVPLRLDPRLRELSLGTWEGLTRAEIAERYPDQYAAWTSGRPVHGRGSEDPEVVAGRALAALTDLPPSAAAVVVTHGGTGLRLIEALLGLDAGRPRVLGALGNCAWSELSSSAGRWRLLRHNHSVGQLPEPRPEAPAAPGPVLRAVPSPDGAAGGRTTAPEQAPAQDADVVL